MDRKVIVQLTAYANANPEVDKRIDATIHRKDYANGADMAAAYYQRLLDAQNAGLNDLYMFTAPAVCEKKFRRVL